MKKVFLFLLIVVLVGAFWGYRAFYQKSGDAEAAKTITIPAGLSVREVATLLEAEGVVHADTWLVRYLVWKKIDTKVQHGDMTFEPPHTIARAARALTTRTSLDEREITLLPGWDLRDIAAYFDAENIAAAEDVYAVVGTPLSDMDGDYALQDIPAFAAVPQDANLEGYLRPDTFRIFASASISEIIDKLVRARAEQFTDEMMQDIADQGKTVHDIMTMASIIEREVRSPEDRRLVSDLFWRRHEIGMALQADSTVHYIVGTDDSVFTTAADRATDSLWNTYKYPGLPAGPISMPSLDSIMAAIYPEANEFWYFLTTLDTGEVKYGRTLDEHNSNVYQYLRR